MNAKETRVCNRVQSCTIKDEDVLRQAEKIGSSLADTTSFPDCRLTAYQNLKVVMHGSNVQAVFMKKGYEKKTCKPGSFNREAETCRFLRGAKCLYGDSEEKRRVFALSVFDWLIRRYDFRSAWKVLNWLRNPDDEKEHRLFLWGWGFCLVLISACFLAYVDDISLDALRLPSQAWLGFGGFIALVLWVSILWVSWKAGDLIKGMRLFVPRFAAAIFLGHLFISSSDEVRVAISCIPWWSAWLVALVLTMLYLSLEMVNQLEPRPSGWTVVQRIFPLVAVGIFWSFAIGLLMRRVFFAIPRGVSAYLTSASVALVLGLFLQILWEEKPVTEPI